MSLLTHSEEEIRANVARVAGSSGLNGMAIPLLDLMADSSDRVVSLAALSLGRIGSGNTKEIVTKLLSAVRENKGKSFDPVLRHAYISALDRLVTTEDLD